MTVHWQPRCAGQWAGHRDTAWLPPSRARPAAAQNHESALGQVLKSYSAVVDSGTGPPFPACLALDSIFMFTIQFSCSSAAKATGLVAPVTVTGNVGPLNETTNLSNAPCVPGPAGRAFPANPQQWQWHPSSLGPASTLIPDTNMY